MILDLKLTESSTMNDILLNLQDEIIYVRGENVEMSRISDLQCEKDLLHQALHKEREIEKDQNVAKEIAKAIRFLSPDKSYDSVHQMDSGSKLELKSFLKSR